MSVYRYTASSKKREEHVETGTVVARDKAEARRKLEEFKFDHMSFKRLTGWSALVSKFTADVK